jgi:hypothetical protein
MRAQVAQGSPPSLRETVFLEASTQVNITTALETPLLLVRLSKGVDANPRRTQAPPPQG